MVKSFFRDFGHGSKNPFMPKDTQKREEKYEVLVTDFYNHF